MRGEYGGQAVVALFHHANEYQREASGGGKPRAQAYCALCRTDRRGNRIKTGGYVRKQARGRADGLQGPHTVNRRHELRVAGGAIRTAVRVAAHGLSLMRAESAVVAFAELLAALLTLHLKLRFLPLSYV